MPIALQRWNARDIQRSWRWRVAETVLLCLGVLLTPARAATQDWYEAGGAWSDGGSWRFDRTVAAELIGMGYTYLRVTSGVCADPDDQAMVFEAALRPTAAGDGSWDGRLEPVGLPALLLWEADPASADAHLVPVTEGTAVVIALDGVPPGVAFTVCVRPPA